MTKQRCKQAFNLACDRANEQGRTMQLRREVEFGKVVFIVNGAVSNPKQR